IDADNKKGALQVVDYLCQMGHRRIAFIGGDINTVNARKRLEGYKAAIKGKARIKDEYIKYGDFSEDSGYHEMLELFNCRQMPSAVFCANDLMALGAIKAIKEKKLSVPRDISIVGFDDLVISEYFDPPLTSVRQPLFHIGKEALITLTGIINKEKKVPQQIEIETRLIKRKSVADIN
ncbi:MAG: substrate-binding domain-containing protein, partial [Elusimicrobiota bacterium]